MDAEKHLAWAQPILKAFQPQAAGSLLELFTKSWGSETSHDTRLVLLRRTLSDVAVSEKLPDALDALSRPPSEAVVVSLIHELARLTEEEIFGRTWAIVQATLLVYAARHNFSGSGANIFAAVLKTDAHEQHLLNTHEPAVQAWIRAIGNLAVHVDTVTTRIATTPNKITSAGFLEQSFLLGLDEKGRYYEELSTLASSELYRDHLKLRQLIKSAIKETWNAWPFLSTKEFEPPCVKSFKLGRAASEWIIRAHVGSSFSSIPIMTQYFPRPTLDLMTPTIISTTLLSADLLSTPLFLGTLIWRPALDKKDPNVRIPHAAWYGLTQIWSDCDWHATTRKSLAEMLEKLHQMGGGDIGTKAKNMTNKDLAILSALLEYENDWDPINPNSTLPDRNIFHPVTNLLYPTRTSTLDPLIEKMRSKATLDSETKTKFSKIVHLEALQLLQKAAPIAKLRAKMRIPSSNSHLVMASVASWNEWGLGSNGAFVGQTFNMTSARDVCHDTSVRLGILPPEHEQTKALQGGETWSPIAKMYFNNDGTKSGYPWKISNDVPDARMLFKNFFFQHADSVDNPKTSLDTDAIKISIGNFVNQFNKFWDAISAVDPFKSTTDLGGPESWMGPVLWNNMKNSSGSPGAFGITLFATFRALLACITKDGLPTTVTEDTLNKAILRCDIAFKFWRLHWAEHWNFNREFHVDWNRYGVALRSPRARRIADAFGTAGVAVYKMWGAVGLGKSYTQGSPEKVHLVDKVSIPRPNSVVVSKNVDIVNNLGYDPDTKMFTQISTGTLPTELSEVVGAHLQTSVEIAPQTSEGIIMQDYFEKMPVDEYLAKYANKQQYSVLNLGGDGKIFQLNGITWEDLKQNVTTSLKAKSTSVIQNEVHKVTFEPLRAICGRHLLGSIWNFAQSAPTTLQGLEKAKSFWIDDVTVDTGVAERLWENEFAWYRMFRSGSPVESVTVQTKSNMMTAKNVENELTGPGVFSRTSAILVGRAVKAIAGTTMAIAVADTIPGAIGVGVFIYHFISLLYSGRRSLNLAAAMSLIITLCFAFFPAPMAPQIIAIIFELILQYYVSS